MLIAVLPDTENPPEHYRLVVPQLGKVWLTANQRLHHMSRARWTSRWREATAWRSRVMPRISDPVYIVAELRFKQNRRRDPANWAPTAKAAVDGLVDGGVLLDDSSKFVTGPDMRLGPLAADGQELLILHIWPNETRA